MLWKCDAHAEIRVQGKTGEMAVEDKMWHLLQ